MRTTVMRKVGIVAACAVIVLALLLPGTGRAKPVLQEGFTTTPTGMTGGDIVDVGKDKGWRGPGGDSEYERTFVEYDLQGLGLNPERGTIEFSVTRDEVLHREAIFTLFDQEGGRLFVFYLYWDRISDGPAIRFYASNIQGAEASAFWYVSDPKNNDYPMNYIPLKGIGGKGTTTHFALTWNGPQGDIYVNGKSLKVKTDPKAPFSELAAAAERLVIGAEFDDRIPKGAWSVSHSPISNFQVHSEVLAPSQFDQPIPVTQAAIASVDHDASAVAGFSGKLVAGDAVMVTLEGTPGGAATFDVAPVPNFRGEIPVSWKGWGVYLEDITFFEEDQVNLRDVREYRVYVSGAPLGGITEETPFVESLEVEEQSYIVDLVTVAEEDGEGYNNLYLEADTPYYIAVMALMDDGTILPVVEPVQGLAMAEVEGAPGTYAGTFTPGYRHRYAEAVVVGRLSSGGTTAVLVAEEEVEIDPSLTIMVEASPNELKADEKSTSEITVTVTDANGEAMQDHEIRFLLATTSQYTGVVGGGQFADEVGGALSLDFRGETDLFGRATATYTAGFAAKTAIIVARDMQSNDVGTGYVKTYINAEAQLELEALQETAGKALGYTITVTSSDEWLTADGVSEARITAFVAKDGIPVEGHRVGFTVAAGSGRIRTVKGETDANGKARAIYTARKKIGTVIIRATDHTVQISGTVQIELRSDAPAKIGVIVTPDVLPADGRSTAEVAVVVTDINDNPNEGVEVEYAVSIGSGRIRDVEPVTNRDGESSAEYVAGTIPGRISIEVTVRSTVPTEEELGAAAELATAVLDYDFY